MNIKRTCKVRGEGDPYQALANAIILCAVKDFRNAARMIRKIRHSITCQASPEARDIEYMHLRIKQYEHFQQQAAKFFLSKNFDALCELDGNELLERLEREIAWSKPKSTSRRY